VYKPYPGVVDRLWFLFFCLLWTMNWLGGMSAITIAISCAKWYFSPDRTAANFSSLTVISAFGTTIRYHWGTAAFGSLLIAIIQFIRSVLLYVQKTYNHAMAGTHKEIFKYVCCCVQCCLYMLECCMKFVSKQAYIQTAIHVCMIPSFRQLLL
jgi:Plasma-membrane choline transporter